MGKVWKILMLEDHEADTELIARALKNNQIKFTHKRIDNGEDFLSSLDTFKPDLILSDHAMPTFDSVRALQILKERNLNIPFILVSGAVSEEFAVTCMKLGADDYVLKSNLSRLPVAIQSAFKTRQQELSLSRQQSALKKQNEVLIKINKELDSFVYNISHNLRSPLASVLGLVHIAKLEENMSRETIHQYLGLIEHSVLKLDETLGEILDYSRNSRTDLLISKIDLEALFRSTFEQMRYLKGYDNITHEIKVNGQADLYSDDYRLRVIFNNLISNAIKYQDETKKSSYIRVTATITPALATIEIADNGIGIEAGLIPHVYKMFYRATDKNEGSGLGLYIVKEMVEKINGDIKLSSAYGKGSTFVLTLPNQAPKTNSHPLNSR
jgi:signal transduction histidine kinase